MNKKARPAPPPSFMWDVIEHDHVKKEYTLKNKATGQIRTVTKELFRELAKEQTGTADGYGKGGKST